MNKEILLQLQRIRVFLTGIFCTHSRLGRLDPPVRNILGQKEYDSLLKELTSTSENEPWNLILTWSRAEMDVAALPLATSRNGE